MDGYGNLAGETFTATNEARTDGMNVRRFGLRLEIALSAASQNNALSLRLFNKSDIVKYDEILDINWGISQTSFKAERLNQDEYSPRNVVRKGGVERARSFRHFGSSLTFWPVLRRNGSFPAKVIQVH